MKLTYAALLNDHFAVIDRADHGRFHLLTQADDPNQAPHDHAEFGFWSTVLAGGYLEEVFDVLTGRHWEEWRCRGDRFRVEADHIHRIVKIWGDVCLTHVAPDVHTGAPHAFAYEWRDGIAYRRPVWQPDGEWERVAYALFVRTVGGFRRGLDCLADGAVRIGCGGFR